MQVIYENEHFYNEFLLITILGLVFFSVSTFLWKVIVHDKDPKLLFLRIMLLVAGSVLLVLSAPYIKDVPSVQKKEYKVQTGTLNDVWVEEDQSTDSDGTTRTYHTTYFLIDQTRHSLDGSFRNLENYQGVELTISYLPHTEKVMQIAIPLTDENNEKLNERFAK